MFGRFRVKGGVIKKPVCWVLLLLLVLPLLTCKNFGPDNHENPNRIIYTDVVYSPDGKSVTIYIDGTTVPVTNRQSRALSKELAIAGHDYFEVAFIAGGPSQVVARASWELNKNAYVDGVAREVNYNTVNPVGLSTGVGAAILFVGKKTDKTLLGIGKLTGTDDGGPGATTITADQRGPTGNLLVQGTRAVTFEVDALKCGVVGEKWHTLANSSFLTSFGIANPSVSDISDTNTQGNGFGLIRDYQIDGKGFSLFKLRENNRTYASYKFFTESGADLNTAYSSGIILAGEGSYGKKQPRYPTGGFQWNAALRLDDRTKVTPVVNNETPARLGMPFENPVIVEFDTRSESGVRDATISGSMFGFVFEIPVYPLSGTPAASGMGAGIWYIRASYDSYWLNLDDGKMSGAGGAVLIGTGDTPNFSDYQVVLIRPANKYKYGFIQPGNVPNFQFFIDGLEVEMQTKEGSKIRTIPNEELAFFIGGYEYFPGQEISRDMYGLQVVVVRYTDPYTNMIYEVTYPIIAGGGNPARDFTRIPLENTVYFDTVNDMTWKNGFLSGWMDNKPSGTFVIVFNGNWDLGNITVNAASDAGSYLIIILAATPEVVLGKENNIHAFKDEGRRHGFWFGTWPFSEGVEVQRYNNGGIVAATITVGTTANKTYPFVVNAGGAYANVSNIDWAVTPPGHLPHPPYPPPPPPHPDPPNKPDVVDAGPVPILPNPPPYGTPDRSKFFITGGNDGYVNNVGYEKASIVVVNEDWLH